MNRPLSLHFAFSAPLFSLLLGMLNHSPLYAIHQLTPEAAWEKMIEGNKRYATDLTIHRDQNTLRRANLIQAQYPIAVIIGCSDSRVPPEIIFDQGLGDIFVVRVAGNVVGAIEADSVEFACCELHVPLIIVLGHQNCGAIKAVLSGNANKYESENIQPLLQPAIELARTQGGDQIASAVKNNVHNVVQQLNTNHLLKPLIQSGRLRVTGAYYHLADGKVEWIDTAGL